MTDNLGYVPKAASTPPPARHVALYARQSKYDLDGIDRQIPRLRQMAADRGWEIYDEYTDPGESASKQRGPDSDWARMLADAAAGRIDTVLAVDLDRLLRSLTDLLILIEHKLMAVTVNGEIDLTTADGEFRATILAAVARFEVRRKGERQSRAQVQRASKGRVPKGQRPLGYATNGDVIPHEAAAARELFRLFAIDDGPSLAALAKGLSGKTGPTVPKSLPHLPKHSHTVMLERNELHRAHGEPEAVVPDDGPWSPSTILGILRNPRYAGYSVYTSQADRKKNKRRGIGDQIVRDEDGEPVRGEWEPIIDELTWWRVQKRLDDPRRIINKTGSTARKHLGAGLYLCARCGKPVRTSSARYACVHCGINRTRSHIDDWVLRVVRARLARPDLADSLRVTDEPRMQAIEAQIDVHRAKILRAQNDYDDGFLEGFDLKRVRTQHTAAIEALEAERRALSVSDDLGGVLGASDPVQAFDDADLMIKRRVIDFFVTVRLHPHPRGKKGFDPGTVEIIPKPVG